MNIKSISNKFDKLKRFVQCKVDILIVTEIKLNSTFPTSQFMIDGYSEPYRFNRNKNGAGVLIYNREDIPSNLLAEPKLLHDIEGIFVELNLRKKKWLLFGSHHPLSQSDEYLFHQVKRGFGMYSKCYERYMLIGDFNAEESEPCLPQFLFQMNAKNIVKEPTCYKSLSNPSYIDLVITNSSSSFQKTKTLSRELSDFQEMVTTVLKQTFQRSSPKELVYNDYKNFDRLSFKRELEEKLNQQINEYRHFEQIFLEVLNTHALVKRKLLRVDHVPYMTNSPAHRPGSFGRIRPLSFFDGFDIINIYLKPYNQSIFEK